MPTENRSSNTEMVSDKLTPCADDVFKKGVSACLVGDVPKHAAETICQSLSAVTGWKIDWHYFGGRTHIKALAPAPQPHPAPIAWMVGTAIWWTKEEAERDAAEVGLPVVGLGPMTESSAPAVSIPDGYCLMPRRLTAENGAKALLLGEFKLEVIRECPECLELDEPAEGCEICDGEGEYAQRHMIPWDKIKFIYSEAVKGLALEPSAAP